MFKKNVDIFYSDTLFTFYDFRSRTLPQIPEQPVVNGNDLDQKKPIDFLNMMFPESLYGVIATETNRYAAQVIAEKQMGPKSSFRKWSEATDDEIRAYLGLRVAMAMCSKPSINDYWSESWLTSTPSFGKVMSKTRFKLLNSFLHFNDNTLRLDRNDPGYDPLFKLRPVLHEVLPAWKDSYTPGKNVAIDESMISYRGRIYFRQYIKSKHHRFGVKAFVMSCATTNFTYKWDIYTGSHYQYDKELGQGHSVVRKLSSDLPQGHVIYLDSFYTTPKLCMELHEKGIGVCGTVSQNRKGMPEALKDRSLKLREGDRPVFRYKSPVLACVFYDRKCVRMLSTVHTQDVFRKDIIVPEAQRDKYPSGQRTTYKPVMVKDYNKFMGGVDRGDQMASYHPFPHRSVKWYQRVFTHILEVCMINARICHNLTHTKKLSQDAFRRELADALVTPLMLSKPQPRPRSCEPPTEMVGVPGRLLGRHFPAMFEKSKPDCIVCSDRKAKRRKQTSFFCKTCPEKPALCQMPCFEKFHTELKYK